MGSMLISKRVQEGEHEHSQGDKFSFLQKAYSPVLVLNPTLVMEKYSS